MGVNRINFRDPAVQRGGLGRFALHVALSLLFAWFLGLMAFIAAIPLVVRDATTRTDAIVVLTGGRDRLAEAFRLLDAGLAPRLLITGVAPGVTLAQVIEGLGENRDAAPSAALQECCITLGYEAGNTVGNAAEGAAWVRANNVRSVRLVTANYHIQRSRLEFRRTLPDIDLVLHPVYPPEVQDNWWFVKPQILALLIGEYHKFVGAWLRASSEGIAGWTMHHGGEVGGLVTGWSLPDWVADWSGWFGAQDE